MSFEKHLKNDILYYTSTIFDSFMIPHFFASKRGGVSENDFSSLNISTNRKNRRGESDSIENVRKNLSRGVAIVGSQEKKVCMMQQIHSTDIAKAQISCRDVFDGRGSFQPCDGVFATKDSEYDTLVAKTADCVPILLYDTKNDVAAALHAGWRGTVGNICGKTVQKMKELNCDAHIISAIGPCILDCCYEVNHIVFDAAKKTCDALGISRELMEKCFPKKYFADGEDKYRVSLSALNRVFLENAGVARENIDEAGLCTCCHTDDDGAVFFSHRASGGFSGTQMSVVRVRNEK